MNFRICPRIVCLKRKFTNFRIQRGLAKLGIMNASLRVMRKLVSLTVMRKLAKLMTPKKVQNMPAKFSKHHHKIAALHRNVQTPISYLNLTLSNKTTKRWLLRWMNRSLSNQNSHRTQILNQTNACNVSTSTLAVAISFLQTGPLLPRAMKLATFSSGNSRTV